MSNKCWLPKIELFEDYNNDWERYQSVLYDVFKNDFLDSAPLFDNERVKIKVFPKEYGKEEAFFHTTCKDYVGGGERVPDLRRCERIRWIRAFIENYDCDPTKCEGCEGVKAWEEKDKGKTRVHLFLEEEKYVVVLEKRKGYYLLITAFYLDYDNAIKKQLTHYERAKKKLGRQKENLENAK